MKRLLRSAAEQQEAMGEEAQVLSAATDTRGRMIESSRARCESWE